MSTPPRPDAGGIYAAMSDHELFSVMAEAATHLTGELVYQADNAGSEEQREQRLTRLREVRDERWSVRAGDRAAQLARIDEWDAERRHLQADDE